MKKLLSLTLTLIALVFCFAGCNKDVKPVVFTADSSVMTITEETTLYDYMTALKEQGKLDFTAEDGSYGKFLSSVNGVSNGVGNNPCWMIYSDDEQYTNNEWGQTEIDGKVYASATLGISDLPVKEGATYVLSYVKLSFNL